MAIGDSPDSDTKCVTSAELVQCALDAGNKGIRVNNDHGTYHYDLDADGNADYSSGYYLPTTFDITVENNNMVCATRTDTPADGCRSGNGCYGAPKSSTGWGMNLLLRCGLKCSVPAMDPAGAGMCTGNADDFNAPPAILAPSAGWELDANGYKFCGDPTLDQCKQMCSSLGCAAISFTTAASVAGVGCCHPFMSACSTQVTLTLALALALALALTQTQTLHPHVRLLHPGRRQSPAHAVVRDAGGRGLGRRRGAHDALAQGLHRRHEDRADHRRQPTGLLQRSAR